MLKRYSTDASAFKRIKCNYIKYSVPRKAKEVHFKTMSEITHAENSCTLNLILI